MTNPLDTNPVIARQLVRRLSPDNINTFAAFCNGQGRLTANEMYTIQRTLEVDAIAAAAVIYTIARRVD